MTPSRKPHPHTLPATARATVPATLTTTLTTTLTATVPSAWRQDLWRRLRRLFWLKFIGISAFMWLFFVGYFHLLRNPVRAVTEMPLTLLDHWVSFQPAALAAYFSLWVYVGIPAGLMPNFRQLLAYGLWVGALCLTGLAIFYAFPTAVPRPDLPLDVALYPGFALLQGVDAAGNACPSLHVASALFSAFWINRLLQRIGTPWQLRALNALWLLLIVYSTMAIKQHVALDVAGGMLLALLFVVPSMRWFPAEPTPRAR